MSDDSLSLPPRPPARPHTLTCFGDTRIDEYAWLRERDDPEVLAHLEREREHTERTIDARCPGLRERLFAEMRGRVLEDDHAVPVREGSWFYYSRTEPDDEYVRHCRVPAHALAGPDPLDGFDPRVAGPHEQVYLDENQLAELHEYFDLGGFETSPDHRLCAYVADVTGEEIHTLHIQDLERGEALPETISGCDTALAWLDDRTLLYVRLDASLRPHEVWLHRVGSDPATDQRLFREDDRAFFVSIQRSRTGAFVVLSSDSQITGQSWLIPTRPLGPGELPELIPVIPRRHGIEAGVEHYRGPAGDWLFVLTNAGARNFRIMLAPLATPGPEHWREFVPHREHVWIEDIDVFASHLIVWERVDGLQQIRVIPLPDSFDSQSPDALLRDSHCIEFDEPAFTIWPGNNPEFEITTLRFGYTSLTTPSSVYDYDLGTRARVLRKRQEVVGGHDPAQYRSARVWAEARDGERVPISLVWWAGHDTAASERPPEPRPLLLHGYGAYGLTSDPSFSSARLSLLRRGLVYAIAHVRGGGELGRRWYETGKLAHKQNTFNDFIDCAEHLISAGWTSADRLLAQGGSAGGLLIGAVVNQRPELFRAVIADVPFVDPLTTMLDPDLPLTVVERDEWGDPTTELGYGWLRGYSPFDNVREQAYPDVLATAGFNDPRVGYWEAAKWVARLRDSDRGGATILLWTNLEAGHGGASGRFEYLHELALAYAFVIDRLGVSNEALGDGF